jgi:hypothetical protein
MYFSRGFRANIETISMLSIPHAAGQVKDFASLKKAYQGYTLSIQPALPQGQMEGIEFNTRLDDLRQYAKTFNEESGLRDIKSSLQVGNLDDAAAKLEAVENVYKKIEARYPELALMLKLTFNTIFSLPSVEAGGGSASSAIGVLWANPRSTWSENDIIEFLVHELAHNLVFLDERRFSHYIDLNAAIQKENWALSAILGRLRPIDKGLHSLIVATEVLLFREKFTGHSGEPYRVHPPSALLKTKALACADSLMHLKNREGLFQPRFIELIEMCQDKIAGLSITKSSAALTLAGR